MEISELEAGELRAALARLLALPRAVAPAPASAVEPFVEYLAAAPVSWKGLYCGPAAAMKGIFLALLLPGRTAIVMVPEPGQLGIESAAAEQVLRAGLERLAPQRLHYAQALLEPEAAGRRRLLERTGFVPLATLEYLERDLREPFTPPTEDVAEWVSLATATEREFAEVVQATYGESLDCPELTGLRPIEDVLAAHRAGGRFDPRLWELARVDGQAAGCVLLTPLYQDARLFELVYMGVVPEFRRRGLGTLLLRRALARCHAAGALQLTVVVDERNTPAQRLYARFGCVAVGRRVAWLYRWRGT